MNKRPQPIQGMVCGKEQRPHLPSQENQAKFQLDAGQRGGTSRARNTEAWSGRPAPSTGPCALPPGSESHLVSLAFFICSFYWSIISSSFLINGAWAAKSLRVAYLKTFFFHPDMVGSVYWAWNLMLEIAFLQNHGSVSSFSSYFQMCKKLSLCACSFLSSIPASSACSQAFWSPVTLHQHGPVSILCAEDVGRQRAFHLATHISLAWKFLPIPLLLFVCLFPYFPSVAPLVWMLNLLG